MVRLFFAMILFLLFLFNPIQSIHAQNNDLIPRPGDTCGVTGDPERQKCCTSNLINLGIDTQAIKDANIPIISGVLGGLGDAVNNLLDDAPFNFVPGNFKDSLPTLGKLKKAVTEIAPCDTYGRPEFSQNNTQCICIPKDNVINLKFANICKNIKNDSERSQCEECIVGKNPIQGSGQYAQGIWTALGCVDTTSPKGFIEKTVMGVGMGLAGIAAFLCIVFAAIQMMLSQGNAERIKKNQELLTSCIMGLILIIFSIFILRLIGVTILRIPGLG